MVISLSSQDPVGPSFAPPPPTQPLGLTCHGQPTGGPGKEGSTPASGPWWTATSMGNGQPS